MIEHRDGSCVVPLQTVQDQHRQQRGAHGSLRMVSIEAWRWSAIEARCSVASVEDTKNLRRTAVQDSSSLAAMGNCHVSRIVVLDLGENESGELTCSMTRTYVAVSALPAPAALSSNR